MEEGFLSGARILSFEERTMSYKEATGRYSGKSALLEAVTTQWLKIEFWS